MKQLDKKIANWQLHGSYITSVISISLVLFLLGLLFFLMQNVNRISNYVRENIGFAVMLKENTKEIDILKLQKELDAKEYVKATKYVTKQEAAKELKEELGEDFVEFLGYNPLPPSIEVQLKARYTNLDSILKIENFLQKYSQVNEVFYQKSLIHIVNNNVRKISIFFILFSILLFVISVALINNTIRLSIYSKRFLIYTMQLVGATESFIRRPFLKNAIIMGCVAALVALTLIMLIINILQNEFSDVVPSVGVAGLFIVVIAFGVIISLLATYFSINRYLRIKQYKLYF